MKILVVSDTHGKHGNLEVAIEKEKPFDMLVHLGDVEDGEDYIRALVDCDVKMISGNNDFFIQLPGELEFTVQNLKVYMTHGHLQYVSLGTKELIREATTREANLVMFGHIHVPVLEEAEGMTILCPGSIAYPRQIGRRGSYAIVHIEDGESPKCEICYL
ncbi:MAG: metallophosphoesterase family protein [Eubacteriales bacterium]